ncbi:MAG: GGDEF domain-containing protein [Eubacteriales bacterium]|nr:GGDEF domain-containing protein [Eubacteriales bacterium]
MKKRIAVFANGWSTEFLRLVLEGIRSKAFELNIDIFSYIGYAVGVRGVLFSEGEGNIYHLPDVNQFDGIILLPGTFNSEAAVEYLRQEVIASGKPAISIEYKLDGIDFIGTENLEASYMVARHMLDVHQAKRFLFMGGPEENKDTKERLQGVQKALQENGIELASDCILNAFYAYKPARLIIEEWIKGHDYLPDAIVCANDDMAIGVCSQLAEMGIRVPEDVLVSGYDGLQAGQRFLPTITSVHRSWSKVGAYAVDNLVDKMNGLITNPYVLLDTRPVYKESCGCLDKSKDDKFVYHIRDLIVKDHTNSLERVLSLEFVSTLCDAMVAVENFEHMSETISGIIKGTEKYFGDVFKIFVNEEFLDFEKEEVRTEGYDDQLVCICDVDAAGYKPSYKLEKSQVLDTLSDTAGVNHFFIILPVQKLGKCYGFVVFDDCLGYIYDYSFSAIEDDIDGAFEQIRQAARLMSANKQLQSLSERDRLTGIYNRVAYDRYAIPLLQSLKEQGKESIVMVVDIDKMKIINDRYGHLQGDVAIKLVAEVLSNTLPKDWVLIRYGGDEYFVLGECPSGEEMDSICNRIYENLEQAIKEQSIPFSLSVSVGVEKVVPTDENDIWYHFKRADESMYEVKEQHHTQLAEQGKL